MIDDVGSDAMGWSSEGRVSMGEVCLTKYSNQLMKKAKSYQGRASESVGILSTDRVRFETKDMIGDMQQHCQGFLNAHLKMVFHIAYESDKSWRIPGGAASHVKIPEMKSGSNR